MKQVAGKINYGTPHERKATNNFRPLARAVLACAARGTQGRRVGAGPTRDAHPTRMPDGLLLLSLLVLLTTGTSGSTRSASPGGGPPPPLSPPSLSPALPPAPGAATAVVTLVNEPGEEAGAIALGASLAMAGSVARRVVLVRGGRIPSGAVSTAVPVWWSGCTLCTRVKARTFIKP